jgi:hypothetical protein
MVGLGVSNILYIVIFKKKFGKKIPHKVMLNV